jgi:hypothetical protein
MAMKAEKCLPPAGLGYTEGRLEMIELGRRGLYNNLLRHHSADPPCDPQPKLCGMSIGQGRFYPMRRCDVHAWKAEEPARDRG